MARNEFSITRSSCRKIGSVTMKTNNKLSAYILRGSTTALFFSCVIVAICSAINLPEQPPKARPPRGNAVFGANGHASAGARVELVKGEVHFSNKAGQGVKIEAPWLIEATGEQRAGAVRWELEESKSGASYLLRLVVAKGLSYPVLIDPSWVPTGSLFTARTRHTATLLPNGKVLVAGGTLDGSQAFSSTELYDPATGTWTATGSLGTARNRHTATLLPSGKVLVAGGFFNGSDLGSAELYDPGSGTWT